MANIFNTTTDIYFDDFTKYFEYRAGILIWKLVSPVLIILGTIGNCLSIIVLTRKNIRSSTTSLFLTVLAVSDLIVLYSGLLRQWTIYLFDIDFRKSNEFGCKFNIWLVYSSLDFSAWILVGVTLERVISSWLPHQTQKLCSKRNATVLLITLGVLILALNSHMLYGMVFKYELNQNGIAELQKCVEINQDYSDFFNKTWPWVDLCVFCGIPLTLIVLGNCLILYKLISSEKKVQTRIVPSSSLNERGAATTTGQSAKFSSASVMLLTLSTVFLFSTLPISIYNIGYTYWLEGASGRVVAQLDLWWAIVNMLMYFNNSVNFLLYCLSGAKFRREVSRILCTWKRNRVHPIRVIQIPGENL